MIINNKRALAYIVSVDDITPIAGADNIELAHVGGWNVIIRKGEFRKGEWGVFFEIDSKLPEKEWSEFLRPKHFSVKTYKLGKFNVISQGLLLPISILPQDNTTFKLLDDVTDVLGVTYSSEQDRKSKRESNPNEKYNRMARRHLKLAKKKWWRWIFKREWGKRLLFFFFGKKNDKPKAWPEFIVKTDEERLENRTFELNNKQPLIVSEKLDGTSTTFFIDYTKKKKYDFGVCSRNVRQVERDQTNYHTKVDGLDNVYWEMADKYDIENVLIDLAMKFGKQRVVIQGETYGAKLQGNPYKLDERRFAVFNLIFDGVRLDSVKAKEILSKYDVPFVPILDTNYIIPDDFEKVKLSADGQSVINKDVIREGLVYRGYDGKRSFKNVSNKYLLKKK